MIHQASDHSVAQRGDNYVLWVKMGQQVRESEDTSSYRIS
jgi:hypothetical protein